MPIIPEPQNGDPLREDRQRVLAKKIDAAIDETRKLLHQRHDRRSPVREHEPERRGGFDRRAKVAPAKK